MYRMRGTASYHVIGCILRGGAMETIQRCLGIIPAYNEARTVGRVIREVQSCHPMDIVVVDDNSTDNTREEARKAGAQVLSLAVHSGAWVAIQAGFALAVRRGYEYAITFDADGQHLPESVKRVGQEISNGEIDVVIGSYPQRGSSLRQIAWSFFRTVSPFSFQDLTSGLRGYNARAMHLLLSPDSYMLDYQDLGVLLLLYRSGLRIGEVPVPMAPRNDGHSRVFNTWTMVVRYMYITSLLCLSKIRS